MPEIRLVAPLIWPADVPRTNERRNGEFAIAGKKATSPALALERLARELGFWEAEEPELAGDFGRTSGGRVSLAADKIGPDPGVLLRFDASLDGKGRIYTLPCDTFTTRTQNILALANHLDATRRIERYGVGTTAQMMGAFASLPAPRNWAEILGVHGMLSLEVAEQAYRERAKKAHPDAGGSDGEMAELNGAISEARAHFGGALVRG